MNYYIIFLIRFKDAMGQLEKGRDLFHDVLSPLAQLPSCWRHVGVVCFPEIESREELISAGIPRQEAEVHDEVF